MRIPPATEAERARIEAREVSARYWPQLARTDKAFLAVLTEEIMPLCKKTNERQAITPAQATKALAQLALVQGDLDRLADAISQAPSYEDPRLNQALGFARDYVKALRDFSEQFRQALDVHGHLKLAPGTLDRFLLRRLELQRNLTDSVIASSK
jgi:hypothetical protein